MMRGQASPPVGEGEEYVLRSPDGPPIYNGDEPREAAIVAWRLECFLSLGFRATVAFLLAQRRDVDRAQVERMVGTGASHAQVFLIVT